MGISVTQNCYFLWEGIHEKIVFLLKG